MSQNLIAAASLSPQVLTSGLVVASGSEVAVYTCPAASSTVLATAWVCNTTSSAVTVSVSVVKNGGTAGAANRIVSSYSLAANDTLSLNPYLGGAMFGPGDFVTVNAGTGSAVAFGATGSVGS